MIKEDLLDFKYYLDRLSKFMQESYGINEQVKIFWSLLKQVNDCYDEFFKEVDFYHHNFESGNGLLDKIGNIFGCQRCFTIPVFDSNEAVASYIKVDLTDEEYLLYIKTQVIKQNFTGDRKTLQELYSTYINGRIQQGLIDLRFLYITIDDEVNGATCNIYWDIDNPSDNLKNLFLNGYLTIESMGIRYRRIVLNFNQLAYYYEDGEIPSNFNYYHLDMYEAIDTEPDDWAENYNKYYIVTASPNIDTNWIENTYYEKVDNDYVLVVNKPANWYDPDSSENPKGSYGNYYTLTIVQNTDPNFRSNIFKHVEKGGCYS